MYFANYFDLKNEREKMINYFASIDTDNDGLLSFEEIVNAYQYKVFLLFNIMIFRSVYFPQIIFILFN